MAAIIKTKFYCDLCGSKIPKCKAVDLFGNTYKVPKTGKINCKPFCNGDFPVDIYTGELSLNCDATLSRTSTFQLNLHDLYNEICNGYTNEVLSEGDRISFQLEDGRYASVTVAAINLYEKNNVIFVFDDLLWEYSMNNRNTNDGGWAESGMVDYMEKEILPLLPKSLIDIITPRIIVQNIDGVEYKRESKLWLPSLTEVIGENGMTEECDFKDKQFPIFKTKKGRVKSLENGDVWQRYWLRSPYGSTTFWFVYNNGIYSSNYANAIYSVCPCFSIGSKTQDG